jgi:hypothetical protein
MFNTRMLLFALCLGATSPLYAAETIQVEKLTKAQLQEALKTSPDDVVIEYRGQSKTKAEWRIEWQAAHKPLDPAKIKAMAKERRTNFEAVAKALQDKQESAIAKENVAVDAEFEALKTR